MCRGSAGTSVQLGGDGQLEVVAGDALVVGSASSSNRPQARRVGGVDVEVAGAAAVVGRRVVEAERAVRRGLRPRSRPAGSRLNHVGHHGPGPGEGGLALGEDLGGARGAAAPGRAQPLVDRRRRRRCRAPRPPARRYSSREGGDLVQAELVDLRGGQGRRGVGGRARARRSARRRGARQAALLVGPGVRRDLVAQHVAVLLEGRPHLGGDRPSASRPRHASTSSPLGGRWST